MVTAVRKPQPGGLLGRLTLLLLLVLAAIVWHISSLRGVRNIGDVQELVGELASEGDQ